MAGKILMITQLVLIFLVLDGMSSSPWPDPVPGPTTPTALTITLNKVSLKPGIRSTDPYIDYITTPREVDVIASSTGKTSPSTDTSDSSFGNAPVPNAEYKSIKLVFDGMARYTGTDPCSGAPATDALIELPTMVAASDDGPNKMILKYQEPHPVNGLPEGSLRIQGFTIGGPTEFRLIFPASNSVICAADVAPLRTISGTVDGPNGLALDSNKGWILVTNGGLSESVTAYDRTGTASAIRASISGTNSGLSSPAGIYVDGPPHNEIGVANTGNNSVTIYNNSPGVIFSDNTTPLHVITGSNTKLNGPGGIAIYADSGDSIIVVANGGNNSVTFYSRNAVQSCVNCNIPPLYNPPLHGSLTGLSAPCGLYVDTSNQEIGVANNGNNSVTVYKLADITASVDGNVPPVRTIQGPDTGLTIPCGLYVDPLHDEIGVTNNGNDTITFHHRTDQGNVAPTRTLRGNATGLNSPVGIYLDTDTDQIVVANNPARHLDIDTITTYYREEPSPARSIPGVPDVPGVQLKGVPALHISAEQQALLVQYFYTGQLNKLIPNIQTGTAMAVSSADSTGFDCNGDGTTDILEGEPIVCFDGYRFNWRITDARVRQLGDASTLGIVPPNNNLFRLTDGSVVSVLATGCPALTPFIILDLFTNCPPSPQISAPLPPPTGDYAIPAVIFQEPQVTNKLPFTTTALTSSQFPQPIPVVGLSIDHDTITDIGWSYASEMATPSTLPLIVSQQIQIDLTRDIALVNPCYTQVSGNAQNLVYVSGSLTTDVRDRSAIKNNGCDIKLSDVATITFTVTDALGNSFVFHWNTT